VLYFVKYYVLILVILLIMRDMKRAFVNLPLIYNLLFVCYCSCFRLCVNCYPIFFIALQAKWLLSCEKNISNNK